MILKLIVNFHLRFGLNSILYCASTLLVLLVHWHIFSVNWKIVYYNSKTQVSHSVVLDIATVIRDLPRNVLSFEKSVKKFMEILVWLRIDPIKIKRSLMSFKNVFSNKIKISEINYTSHKSKNTINMHIPIILSVKYCTDHHLCRSEYNTDRHLHDV